MNHQIEKFNCSGTVTAVTFKDEESGFHVLRLSLDNPEQAHRSVAHRSTIIAKGTISGTKVEVGTWLSIKGHWVDSGQYGTQLFIDRSPHFDVKTSSPDLITKMLKSAGVPVPVCDALCDFFRESAELISPQFILESREMLEKSPVREQQIDFIMERWRAAKSYYMAMEFLADIGVNSKLASKTWLRFGEELEEIISSNPWRLAEIDGVTMHEMDCIGRTLGHKSSSKSRLEGAVLYGVKSQRGNGDLFIHLEDLSAIICANLSIATKKNVLAAVKSLAKKRLLVLEKKFGVAAVYEPWFFELEERSASLLKGRIDIDDGEGWKLKRLSSVSLEATALFESGASKVDIVRAVVSDSMGELTCSVAQREAIENALIHPVSILTGLPGTGKTTSLKVLVDILEKSGIKYILLAPTGIAAKRMSSIAGAEAFTVHRAFKAKIGREDDAPLEMDMGGQANEENYEWGLEDEKHPAEYAVIDESSMICQNIGYRILRSTTERCRLVFVGDAQQLPSVGPGDVLRGMIKSKMIPTVALTEVFRQAEASDIIKASHAINSGTMPTLGGDFELIKTQSDDEVVRVISSMVVTLRDKKIQFQVLCPRHGGDVGVNSLNEAIRERINPLSIFKRELKVSHSFIREGDRVMVMRNDYDLKVFNGDVGKVLLIDSDTKEMTVKIYDDKPKLIKVRYEDVRKLLKLAYCVTVHKCQGLEYDQIVMPIIKGFGRQLQRNLIYTAITRAKQRVILVGEEKALSTAIKNFKEDSRNTLFSARIKDQK